MTYLANRPSRSNPILPLTPIIQTLVRATRPWVHASAAVSPDLFSTIQGVPRRAKLALEAGGMAAWLAVIVGGQSTSVARMSEAKSGAGIAFIPDVASLIRATSTVGLPIEQLPQHVVHGLTVLLLLRRRIALRRSGRC